MEPIYFTSAAEFDAWLGKHHAATKEISVGFYKKDSGQPSLTWPEYRKTSTWWVISAKKEATRHKRLPQLIEDSANGQTLHHLTRLPASKP